MVSREGITITATPIIIGLTGSFGSGCSHLAEKHLVPKGFEVISLSQILKEEFKIAYDKEPTGLRREMQDFGNELRQAKGESVLAQMAANKIEGGKIELCVIDSIKNPHEVKYLRDKFSYFYLVGVFADFDLRWDRKKDRYQGNQQQFIEDDKRDSNENVSNGQRVRDSFAIADLIFINNKDYNTGSDAYNEADKTVMDFLELIEKPSWRPPSEEESFMAVAYANSFKSSCLKRKVGAVLVDERGTIISSGCNEVPFGELPCKGAHGNCYRDILKTKFEGLIEEEISSKDEVEVIKKLILKEHKMLERCRALHAEENTILNIARIGTKIDLSKATLYTTTYPCNLCANKIAEIGIGKIVYLEPYPQKEAKDLLTAKNIKQKSFEGVSFKGFFKLFGSENL